MSPVPIDRSELDEAVAAVREGFGQPSLAVTATANLVVARLFAWASERDDAALLGWIAQTCRRYSNVREIAPLLAGAPHRAFGPNRTRERLGVRDADVDALGQRVAGAVDEAWRPLFAAGDLDEVDALIDEFVVALEGVDMLTAEHSRAVAAWCARIARRMGLSVLETTFARRAGLLHDVGKIAIPPTILTAPRALEAHEWTVMRAHPAEGERLLAGSAALTAFVTPVRNHHERLDGRGYPDGLRAGDLPVTTRIVAVADGFNAMIARRPYRRPMHPVAALEELGRHAGTQFDSEVVSALTNIVGPRPGGAWSA